jgi:hypothetical protein
MMAIGQRMNDPRPTGFAMQNQAWIALINNDYIAALNFAETAMDVAIAPYDVESARNVKIAALVLARRPEAFQMAQSFRDQCLANGWNWHLTGVEGFFSIALVLRGYISTGIASIEKLILKTEGEGWRSAADWFRLSLCEIYLEIIAGNEKPAAKVLARNLLTIMKVMFTAERRISTLVECARLNPQFDPSGLHIGRCEMILGLLYKIKKKHVLAVQHLIEAQRILAQFGQTPILARVETALAELKHP